jgi:DNA polymerase elongation subunit (family B)
MCFYDATVDGIEYVAKSITDKVDNILTSQTEKELRKEILKLGRTSLFKCSDTVGLPIKFYCISISAYDVEADSLYPYDGKGDSGIRYIPAIFIYGVTDTFNDICIVVTDFEPTMDIERTGMSEKYVSPVTVNKWFSRSSGHMITKAEDIKQTVFIDETGKYKRILYSDFVRLTFNSFDAERHYTNILKNARSRGDIDAVVGNLSRDIPSEIKFVAQSGINSAGWNVLDKAKIIKKMDFINCTHMIKAQMKRLRALSVEETEKMACPALIMTFDIEVDRSKLNEFPDPRSPGSVIFDIGISFCLNRIEEPLFYISIVLKDSEFNQKKKYKHKRMMQLVCKNEKGVLIQFCQTITRFSPDIILHYNGNAFDWNFILERMKFCKVDEFYLNALHKNVARKPVIRRGSFSNAIGVVEYHYPLLEGIANIDVLTYLRREYKLPSYALVATVPHFCKGREKVPLTSDDLWHYYRSNSHDKLDAVYYYCLIDSVSCHYLSYQTNMINRDSLLASLGNVMLDQMTSHGQSIRSIGVTYKWCLENKYVIATKFGMRGMRDNIGKYSGALVDEPEKGYYPADMVVVMDFNSLYPSVIIESKICPSRLLSNPKERELIQALGFPVEQIINTKTKHSTYFIATEYDPRLILKYTKIVSGEHNVLQELGVDGVNKIVRHYNGNTYVIDINGLSFLPRSVGAFPFICEVRISERKRVKEKLKNVRDKIKELQKRSPSNSAESAELQRLVHQSHLYNDEQLALKIDANSKYGILGDRNNILYAMSVAESVTTRGRQYFSSCNRAVDRTQGTVIYGDTDSKFIKFPIKKKLSMDENLHKSWTITEKTIIPEVEVAIFTKSRLFDINVTQIVKDFAGLMCERNKRHRLRWSQFYAMLRRYMVIKIEVEKVILNLLLMTKKKYSGTYAEKDSAGKFQFTYKSSGDVAKKRDFAPLIGKFSKMVATYLQKPETTDRHELSAIIIRMFRNYAFDALNGKFPYVDYVLSRSFKGFDKYVNPNDVAHVAAALKQRERNASLTPGAGERIQFIYTKNKGTGPYLRDAKTGRNRIQKASESAETITYFEQHTDTLDPWVEYYIDHFYSSVGLILELIYNPLVEYAVDFAYQDHLRFCKEFGLSPFVTEKKFGNSSKSLQKEYGSMSDKTFKRITEKIISDYCGTNTDKIKRSINKRPKKSDGAVSDIVKCVAERARLDILSKYCSLSNVFSQNTRVAPATGKMKRATRMRARINEAEELYNEAVGALHLIACNIFAFMNDKTYSKFISESEKKNNTLEEYVDHVLTQACGITFKELDEVRAGIIALFQRYIKLVSN